MIWTVEDLNKRTWEFERDYPHAGLWEHPDAIVDLFCELWLLEPPLPMSGVEQQWRVDGKTETDLTDIVNACLSAQVQEEGSGVAVAMMEMPIFELKDAQWEVGDFTTKDQARLRRIVPRGMLLLMREIIAQKVTVDF